MKAVEQVRGERWEGWAELHGDWGRAGLMHVAVRHGGLRLAGVVEHTGLKYQAAAQAVKRFEQAMAHDRDRKDFVTKLKRQMSII